MANTLPITQATANDLLRLGTPTIANVAQGIASIGSDHLKVGKVATSPLIPAAALTLNLNQAATTVAATAVRFMFGGAIVQPSVTLGDTAKIGKPTVANKAVAVIPVSFFTSSHGKYAVLPALPSINLDINLSNPLGKQDPVNTAFYFGGKIVAVTKGADSQAFGKTKIGIAHSIKPLAIYDFHSDYPIVYRGADNSIVNFKFIDTTISVNPKSARLDFGSNRPISQLGGADTGLFGLPSAANKARALIFVGSGFTDYGHPQVYSATQSSQLNLDFFNTTAITDARNIPFYFFTPNYISTDGSNTASFGLAIVVNKHAFIQLRTGGDNAHISSFGQPQLVSKNSYIISPAITTRTVFGVPEIINGMIFIKATGVSASIYGGAWLSHMVRKIEQFGSDNQKIGTQWVSFSPRMISPMGIDEPFIGLPKLGGDQTIAMYGFDGAEYGATIYPESQRVYVNSFIGSFGNQQVFNKLTILNTYGFTAFDSEERNRFGSNKIYNSTQIVSFVIDAQSDLAGLPKFGRWLFIENRNKTVKPSGVTLTQYGYQLLYNNARVVTNNGHDSFSASKSFISHAIRAIGIDGVEPVYISGWSVIYNKAKPIAPSGLAHTAYGRATVESNLQEIKRLGNFESQQFGEGMVGFAIRKIDIERRYGIEPPTINLPNIRLHTRYVVFAGNDMAGYSAPDLLIRWTYIVPRWNHKDFIGEATLKNNTPQYFVFGNDTSDFGATNIRTQWREVKQNSSELSLFGYAKISDTKQWVLVKGFDDEAISTDIRTKKTIPPLAMQLIENAGTIGVVDKQVPIPSFIIPTIYPTGIIGTAFGSAIIIENAIHINSGINDFKVGNLSIRNNANIINAAGFEINIKVGHPRFSPNYIYAPLGDQAPSGYIPTMPNLHIVDNFNKMGYPAIESKHRIVRAVGSINTSFGYATVFNKRAYLYATGIRAKYVGIPTFLNVAQTIDFDERSAEWGGVTFGIAQITRPIAIENKKVIIDGVSTSNYGYGRIENKNRSVQVIGSDCSQIGYSRQNDKPYMWQSLRVGEHIPFIIGGAETASYGDAFISNRVREILVSGDDYLSSIYNLSQFSSRLKVTRVEKPIEKILINNQGDAMSDYGRASIKNNLYYVTPDGNSETYRQGVGEWI